MVEAKEGAKMVDITFSTPDDAKDKDDAHKKLAADLATVMDKLEQLQLQVNQQQEQVQQHIGPEQPQPDQAPEWRYQVYFWHLSDGELVYRELQQIVARLIVDQVVGPDDNCRGYLQRPLKLG